MPISDTNWQSKTEERRRWSIIVLRHSRIHTKIMVISTEGSRQPEDWGTDVLHQRTDTQHAAASCRQTSSVLSDAREYEMSKEHYTGHHTASDDNPGSER
ncbi:hypothetical protein JTB14_019240 [Gonioctena quinquepunctata]|nr:hypothetical protein JTB14_019240 [Gonioctena quinquepunctata]